MQLQVKLGQTDRIITVGLKQTLTEKSKLLPFCNATDFTPTLPPWSKTDYAEAARHVDNDLFLK